MLNDAEGLHPNTFWVRRLTSSMNALETFFQMLGQFESAPVARYGCRESWSAPCVRDAEIARSVSTEEGFELCSKTFTCGKDSKESDVLDR